jgi:ATP-dependent RNA helicase DDX21
MNPATILGSADGAASDLYEEYSPAAEQVGEQLVSDDEEIDPADVRNFPICEQTMDILAARGITKLFPVQAATFNEIYNGRDVLARARTGTGKTLGFALPILERLLLDKEAQAAAGTGRRRGGQKPACVILSPTRELAQQVRRLPAQSLRGGHS